LKTPAGLGTRPTSARVREALFAILGDVAELSVVDLYAGSGALGIEALSRGAAHAFFVEAERKAIACIRENLESLALSGSATLVPQRVERLALETMATRGPIQLLLADPPWANRHDAELAIARLRPVLAPGARVALEHARGESAAIEGLERVDERGWGDTAISFFVAE
jgi:16S rRNA (guanine966-N2)-methyltransferase